VKKLGVDFYRQAEVTLVARLLLGKVLVSRIGGVTTAGRIVETEAYNGVVDKASHAYGGRRTARTEIMYNPGGVAYVYLCYGIHHLFNVVTNQKEIPHAVLIRAVEPLQGLDTMVKRRQKQRADETLTRGPGSVSSAFAIQTIHSGLSLLNRQLYIADDGLVFDENAIAATPRIGVDYAEEDALLPYRFLVKGNKYVSGSRKMLRF
jgi:DNA-3-methyladenine glycosylase